MEITPPRSFPFCIVWTPIPLITWVLPFVGHMGVARADGTILDFLGHFHVQVGDFGFGAPTRYLRLDPIANGTWSHSSGLTIEQWWNKEINQSAAYFRTCYYNFCGTNCHSFVSYFLNSIDYNGSMKWNSLNLGIVMFLRSTFVSFYAFIKTVLPFALFFVCCVYWGRWIFLTVYAAAALIAIFYFFILEYCCNAQMKLRDRQSIS